MQAKQAILAALVIGIVSITITSGARAQTLWDWVRDLIFPPTGLTTTGEGISSPVERSIATITSENPNFFIYVLITAILLGILFLLYYLFFIKRKRRRKSYEELYRKWRE